ncbi:MAG: hypothetical protein WCJ57_00230 [Candidatus Falkowbacteria bacterium]
MKKQTKVIILSVVLGVGLYLFARNFFIQPDRQKKAQEYSPAVTSLSGESKSDPMKFLSTLSNAEIIVPGILDKDDSEGLLRVRLENNQVEFFTDNFKGSVTMLSILKTQKTVDGVDVFCDLIVNYGKPQDFHFVALFKLADNSLVHTSSFSVGSQAKIIEVIPEINNDINYKVKGSYLNIVASEDKEFTFLVKNHKIIQ